MSDSETHETESQEEKDNKTTNINRKRKRIGDVRVENESQSGPTGCGKTFTEAMHQENELFSSALTNIGNGEILTSKQLELIESRFVTKEEAERLCPKGVRLFFEYDGMDAHNNAIFSKCANKIESFAYDTIIGCDEYDFERDRAARIKLHELSLSDTGGLPYFITFALKQSYMITTNIDVADGLVNGVIGELVYVEKVDINNQIDKLWLIFPKNVGAKVRSKNRRYAQKLGISHQATPIGLTTAIFPVDKNNQWLRGIQVERQQFPLSEACSNTIRKSQKRTFDGVIYTYSRSDTQQVVHFVLSRVTNPEKLFIVAKNNRKTFYHGRRSDDSVKDLSQLDGSPGELLSNINLQEMTLFSFDCQSVNKHGQDSHGNVLKNSDTLLLSETCSEIHKHVEKDNLFCVVKRSDVEAGDVKIDKNIHKSQHVVRTEHADMYARDAEFISTHSSSVGNLCAAQCKMSNGKKIIIVSFCVSPGKSIKDIEEFLHFVLLPYTEGGSKLLEKNYHEIPMIIAGNFNVDFANEESLPLIQFLKDKLNLNLMKGGTTSTTRHEATMDTIFTRFIDDLSANICVSHFSHRKPIVADKNIFIEEIDM